MTSGFFLSRRNRHFNLTRAIRPSPPLDHFTVQLYTVSLHDFE